MKPVLGQPMAACPTAEPATRPRSARRMIPICSWCLNVRNEAGRWIRPVFPDAAGSGVTFTHGVCPECAKKVFPRRIAAA